MQVITDLKPHAAQNLPAIGPLKAPIYWAQPSNIVQTQPKEVTQTFSTIGMIQLVQQVSGVGSIATTKLTTRYGPVHNQKSFSIVIFNSNRAKVKILFIVCQ